MLRYLTDKLSVEYNVFVASNGKEALLKIKSIDKLDLIISDIMMDQLDGFAFGEILKGNSRYSHIPLLYLTAKSRSSSEMKSLKLGALDYIEKPFRLPLLLEKVRAIITNSNKVNQALIEQIQSSLRLSQIPEQETTHPEANLAESYRNFGLTSREIEITELIFEGEYEFKDCRAT